MCKFSGALTNAPPTRWQNSPDRLAIRQQGWQSTYVKQVQYALKEWRGSSKAQLLTQAEDGDSLSVTSNAEAAEIVINGPGSPRSLSPV